MRISSSVNEGICKKLRILLVDDEPDVVEVFGRGFKLKGMQVDAYTSPQEALESFKPNTYDLAILDIRMPDMTCFQLYREMKKRDSSITTCFLFAFEIQANEFKSVFPSMDGVKAIIKKPISINELLNEITPFLEIPAAARARSTLEYSFCFSKIIKC